MTVAGHRVSIESKPLELLRELLLHADDLVSKSELLDSIWPNVTVVEASLPTAIRKLRLALNDDARGTHIIETVPRIGYRLAVPVEAQELTSPSNQLPDQAPVVEAAAIGRPQRNLPVADRLGVHIDLEHTVRVGVGAHPHATVSVRHA